jgi:site-specific recombinase XerD
MTTIEDAMQNYLRNLAIRQTAQTVETYAQGVQRFKEYLSTQQISLAEPISVLTVNHALGCVKWLSEDYGGKKVRLAKTTLRTYLSSISRFYTYLLHERLIDLTLADMQEMRDVFHGFRHGARRKLPKLPPEEAVTALLDAAQRIKPQPKKPRLDLARLRNIAMLEALRASGMRVGELVGLKRDDLDYRNHTARVTGKGDRQRVVYFDDAAWNAIQAYLKARNDGARGRALYQLALFARHDRRASNKVLPMTTDGVRLMFNALARAAGIEIAMTPHSLRHAFATKILEATGDLAVAQDMLGHASPATTRVYAKVSSKRMRDAHRTAFGYQGAEDA